MRQTRLIAWSLLALGACTSPPPASPPVAYTLTPGRAWAMYVAAPKVGEAAHLHLRLLGRTTQGTLHLNVVAAEQAHNSLRGGTSLLVPGTSSLLPRPWHFTRQQLTRLEVAGGDLDLALPPAFGWPRAGIFLVLESLPTQPTQQVLGLVSSPQLKGLRQQYVIIGPDSVQLAAARQVSADSFPHLLSYLDQSGLPSQLVYRRHTNETSWQRMTGTDVRFNLETRLSAR